jgi:hypothetical protein
MWKTSIKCEERIDERIDEVIDNSDSPNQNHSHLIKDKSVEDNEWAPFTFAYLEDLLPKRILGPYNHKSRQLI